MMLTHPKYSQSSMCLTINGGRGRPRSQQLIGDSPASGGGLKEIAVSHAYPRRSRTIEEIRLDGLSHVGAKLIPAVCLREDAFPQSLCDKAAIGFLSHLENKLIHAGIVRRARAMGKMAPVTAEAALPLKASHALRVRRRRNLENEASDANSQNRLQHRGCSFMQAFARTDGPMARSAGACIIPSNAAPAFIRERADVLSNCHLRNLVSLAKGS
jgi:hypothetical protein